jgi:hypothetical protein
MRLLTQYIFHCESQRPSRRLKVAQLYSLGRFLEEAAPVTLPCEIRSRRRRIYRCTEMAETTCLQPAAPELY